MALRGETIGTAYIRIIADGSGMNKQLEEMIRNNDPIFEDAAKENATAYDEAFAKQREDNDVFAKDHEREMAAIKGKFDALGHFAGSEFQQQFADEVRDIFITQGTDPKEAELIGRRAGQMWADGFRKSGQLDFDREGVMSAAFASVEDEIRSATANIIKFEGDWHSKMSAIDKDTKTAMDGALASMRDMESGIGDVESAVGDLEKITSSFRFNSGQSFRAFSTGWRSVKGDIGDADRSISGLGDRIGRAFGKTSRNDALNFFGSIIGKAASGLIGIIRFAGKAASTIFNLGKKMLGFGKDAEKAAQTFGQQVAGMAEQAGAFAAKSGPAFLAIIAGIVGIAGPAAGLISGLAAAIIALGGAVAFALGAGFGVFVGLFPVLAIGIGGLMIALQALGRRGLDPLKKQIKPITDEFHRLQTILVHGLLGGGALDNLGGIVDLLKSLEPLARGVGKAFGELVKHFSEAAKSPGVKNFVNLLTVYVPRAIVDLGTAFGHVVGGFAGIFKAALPITKDFIGWISKGAKNFSDWANSAKGQSALKDFFDKGAKAAKSIWNVLKPLGKAIGELFSAGEGSGVGILDNLAKKMRDFLAFIQKNKKNGNLAQWFDQGKEIIDGIGGAIQGVIDVFNALDTKTNRTVIIDVFKVLKVVLEGVAEAIKTAYNIISALFRFIIKPGWDHLTFVLGKVWDAIKAVGRAAVAAKNFFVAAWGKIEDAAGHAWDSIKQQFNNIVNGAKTIAGNVANFFSNAWDNIKKGFTTVKDWVVQKAQDIVSFVKSIPGRISDLASNFLQAGKDLGGAIIDGIRTAIIGAADFAGSIASSVGSAILGIINGLIDKLNGAIPNSIGPINLPDNPIGHISLAQGGVVFGPTRAVVGEAGPEAVVPLSRPLSQVDPAVRELAAFAQGKAFPGSRSIDIGGITIVTPTKNPAAVAQETINKMTAAAYF